MESTDDQDVDLLAYSGWAIPLDEPVSTTETQPEPERPAALRLWTEPDETSGSLFRWRSDDDTPPENGSLFRLRKRGDAA
ncbi:MAG: hypothetical protein LC104_09085 [Bacteroidales bacterium]|nr:hypothetical protein [Bacteroidales bacterium]